MAVALIVVGLVIATVGMLSGHVKYMIVMAFGGLLATIGAVMGMLQVLQAVLAK